MIKDELNRADVHADNIGVVGDHAHVDGGIHFHYHETTSTPPQHEGRHDFYRHIPMPDHYIPRPEALDALREALLSGEGAVALTSAVKVALHGMGGIGKSVLARALCDDPAVQAAFPDGILWTTLGRDANEPALRSKLREWVETLGGIISENAPTLDQLKNKLAQLLEARACLLIVDDAWQHTHATAFQTGGTRCRLLLTTRDAEVARAVGATVHPVEILPVEQAVALLQEWAQGNLAAAPPDVLNQIVKRLGCLPLALKLAGAQLREKDPARWLQTFNVRKLKARRPETPHDSLEQTLALSLDALPPVDRHCYTALAIFKEDEPIPLCAITRLWGALAGLDADESTALLDDLAAGALLQLSSRHSEERSDEETQTTLHDLLRDFIKAELAEAGVLAAHCALLEAYHATKTGEGWHTAPDDDYLYTHLVYHLDAVGDYAALKTLFADTAWMHVRVPADGDTYDGYLNDLAMVWRRAQGQAMDQIAKGQPPVAVINCIHYALIHTTVNSLATNYVPELVARAVETGLWALEQGMSILRHVVYGERQAKMATALLKTGCLPKALRNEAQRLGLEAARAVEDEEKRALALAALAPHLTNKTRTQAVVEGLAAIRVIEKGESQAMALAALAPQLTGDLLVEGLAAARAIEKGESQAMALAALAPQLTGDLLVEGLAAARAIKDRGYRAKALAALAPTSAARDQVLAEGLAVARAVGRWGGEICARILTTLAPQLTGNLLVEGLAVARAIEDERYRAKTLTALAPQRTDNLWVERLEQELASHFTGAARDQVLVEWLEWLCAHENEERQVEVLAELASRLTGAARDQVLARGLAVARAIRREESRAKVLAVLAPQLTGSLLVEGLAVARVAADEWILGRVLAALAPYLTDKTRTQALVESLAAVRADTLERTRTETLEALAPQLTDDLLVEGLAAARELRWEESRALALSALASHLTGDFLMKELAAVGAIKQECRRAEVLAALAPQLTGDLLTEGLAIARAIEGERCRAKALTALAPQLTDDLLVEGLAMARVIEDEWRRAEVLVALAPQLTGDLLTEGLAIARAIEGERCRAKVLTALAPQLTDDLLVEGLAAGAIADEWRWAEVLATLAPQLTGDLLMEGLTIMQTIHNEGYRTGALTALAPQLTGDLLTEGLAMARAIEDQESRAKVLIALAPQLTNDLLTEGLAAACAIEKEEDRAEVLATLAPQLTGELLVEGFAAACTMEDKWSRAKVLVALAPQLTGELLIEGLVVARTIKNEGWRAWVLTALAPQLTGDLLVEGLAAAHAIISEWSRAEVLAAMALLTGIPGPIFDDIRRALLRCLWELQISDRATLLEFLARNELAFLRALGVSQKGFDQIAQSIIDICTKWDWI